MGKKHFCFFQTAETGNRTPNSGVKGGGANHYPRAPARVYLDKMLLKLIPYIHVIPLELEGAKLPLYKVAVYALLTPRGRYSVVKEKYSLAIGRTGVKYRIPAVQCQTVVT